MKIITLIDDNLERWVLILILVIMTTLIGTQIFMRYILQNASSWTEELVGWSFVWFIWLGISYGFKERKHISISIFMQIFSKKIQFIINILVQIIMLIFFIRIALLGWDQAISPFIKNQTSMILYWPLLDEHISMFWLYASMPLGALLSAYRLIQNIIIDIVLYINTHKTHLETLK